jgi:hypothetical protein
VSKVSGITYGEHIVDNTCMAGDESISARHSLMENFYGDIVSIFAGLVAARAGSANWL